MNKLSKLLLSGAFCLSLATGCQSGAKELYQQAVEQHKQEQYAVAIATYERLLEEYPRSRFVAKAKAKKEEAINSLIAKGDQQLANEAYFQAISFYETALQYRPDSQDLKVKLNKAKELSRVASRPGNPPVRQHIDVEVKQPGNAQQPPAVSGNQPDRVDVRVNQQPPPVPAQDQVNLNLNRATAAPAATPRRTPAPAPTPRTAALPATPTPTPTPAVATPTPDEPACYRLSGSISAASGMTAANVPTGTFPLTMEVCEVPNAVDDNEVRGTVTVNWPDGAETSALEGTADPNNMFELREPRVDSARNGTFTARPTSPGSRSLEGTYSLYNDDMPQYDWRATWSPRER